MEPTGSGSCLELPITIVEGLRRLREGLAWPSKKHLYSALQCCQGSETFFFFSGEMVLLIRARRWQGIVYI